MTMSKMLFMAHGSLRFETDTGKTIYLDPAYGEGYDLPADIVLVTHQHHDHNRTELMPKNPGCLIVTEQQALADGKYNIFEHSGIRIESVPADNQNHPRNQCVGYILTFDKKSIYCAGDTSTFPEMESFAARQLDYALLPIDGVYNMDADEASKCAKIIKAHYTVPIHTGPDNGSTIRDNYNEENAARFSCPGKLLIRHGEEITL